MEQNVKIMTHIVSTKRLSSGKYVDLSNLSIDDIDIEDISRSLNYIYRFTGHWKDREPLTVAEHTMLVVQLCETLFPDDLETKLDCVIHDFPESYTGDVATPLKKLFGQAFKDYEGAIEDIVYAKFYTPVIGHELTKETYEKRKICDLLALDIERRAIWSDPKGKQHWPEIPMESVLKRDEKTSLYRKIKQYSYDNRGINLIRMYESTVEQIKNEREANGL